MKVSISKATSTNSTTHLNKVYCLIGPSGAGKSSIAREIGLPEVISYRTRQKLRPGEVNGVDGHFISREEFLEMKKQNLWITETEYAGDYYGITQGELLELENSPMVYVIDWPGLELFREGIEKIEGYSRDQIVSIFIHTPRKDLESRMIRQGRNKEEIRARLDRADRDYAASSKCDYVVANENGDIKNAVCEILKIILADIYREKEIRS
ncbi:hypothetical protein BV582_20870 [Bacillus paralicheniformis]|uniref:guanylate kinase n=1 Tax=Bacillus paralicheniformis TaxID=1648923 RepID=UPI000CC8569C|nr:hypothetical protein [Bacillus paralicheniformis]PLC14028.1 hypothetical protein BV582_20870 [Bacillus paralicheniformis]